MPGRRVRARSALWGTAGLVAKPQQHIKNRRGHRKIACLWPSKRRRPGIYIYCFSNKYARAVQGSFSKTTALYGGSDRLSVQGKLWLGLPWAGSNVAPPLETVHSATFHRLDGGTPSSKGSRGVFEQLMTTRAKPHPAASLARLSPASAQRRYASTPPWLWTTWSPSPIRGPTPPGADPPALLSRRRISSRHALRAGPSAATRCQSSGGPRGHLKGPGSPTSWPCRIIGTPGAVRMITMPSAARLAAKALASTSSTAGYGSASSWACWNASPPSPSCGPAAMKALPLWTAAGTRPYLSLAAVSWLSMKITRPRRV
mmetsp:Transcript_34467/g.92377  ORF Transcript_34467/g.92377 Transcript_34467/m.92377 type:complete len:315 (-) Transcript_34467:222-1166(-)